MKRSYDQLLDAVVVRDSQAFAALEEEWEELHQNSPLATPFQAWAWLYTWWEYYGKDYELRLITLRDERGLLVGIIPLMLRKSWWGFNELLFIGAGLTDYLDFLVRRGWEEQVAEAGVQALQYLDSWHVADLQQLRPEAAAWNIIRKWPKARTHIWQSSCPLIDVKPWDELLASLSRKVRSDIRRTLRRAEADGLRRELASVGTAERAGRSLVTLHREAWRERPINPTHLDERFESHLVAASVRLTSRGLGGISELWLDGEVVASNLLLFGNDFIGGYVTGASQKALKRYQVSTLNIWDAINIAHSSGRGRLNLLRGEEPYKLRWNPNVVSNHRVILGRRLVTWAPYAGYYALRYEIRRYILAHREIIPRWTRSLAAKYCTPMYRVVR